jgi:hypothetical protein
MPTFCNIHISKLEANEVITYIARRNQQKIERFSCNMTHMQVETRDNDRNAATLRANRATGIKHVQRRYT